MDNDAVDTLGQVVALQWCIAYLMADHCRQSAEPVARLDAILGYAKRVAAIADTKAPEAPSAAQSAAMRVLAAEHRTYSALQREVRELLDHEPPA